MNTESMSLYCTVYEEGNIAHAAEVLFLSHQAVSKRIKAIEAELGTTLFERSVKGLAPTKAGQDAYRTFKSRMLAFYEEEDLVGQLQWINWTFWLGLAVGIAALLFLVDSPVTGSFLNVVFSICFLLMYVFFDW